MDEVYETIRLSLAPLGVRLPVEPIRLGSGTEATAYATSCGRVVKATHDRSERFAAMLVMQQREEAGSPSAAHAGHRLRR
jgi:hypothetical protein